MSDQSPGGWTTPPPVPPPTPPTKRSGPFKAGFFGCFGVLAAAVVIIIVVVVLASSGAKQAAPTPTVPGAKPAAATPAATSPVAYTPSPKDFKLTVKILSKECFGSAGCNITFRVGVGYSGEPLDAGTTWEVVYEIRGSEDGPQINTLTVQGSDYQVDREEFASTSSSSTRLTARVTSVEHV